MEKKLIELLTDEEILLFKTGGEAGDLGRKCRGLQISELMEISSFLGVDIQVMLGRIMQADGGMA